jgi:N-methylhydantoinase B
MKDVATVEIIRNRLESITREMCATIRQTAYSPTMYSGGDYSAAIFDGAGSLVSLATKIPLHIMPILHEVRQGLQKYGEDIRDGDIFITNSPYHGSTHLPDVNVFIPIFIDAQLMFFTATRAHWTDIGGMTPGSISGAATEIFQEGLQFPLLRLGRGDQLDRNLLDLIAANVRLPREALGDMRAQVAACHTGRRHVFELTAKYGVDTVGEACRALLSGTEARIRRLIRELPDTTVSHVEYLDNDGVSSDPVRLKVSVTIRGDEILVDFGGCSPQVAGPINSPESVSAGMAYVGIKAFLDPTGPVDHGFVRPITVSCPPGTVVNPIAPAATGGFTEVAYNLADLVLVALADIDPSRACAWGSATSNHQYVAGHDPRAKKRFIYYDYQPGGCGATAMGDGVGTTRDLASGFTQLQSIEIVESRFPVKIRRHEIRKDSGGPGKWRGGWGHIRDVEVHGEKASISIIGEHAIFPPSGLTGGEPGAVQRWTLITEEGESALSPFGAKLGLRRLPGRCVIRVMTAGGGGFGDPLERDPALVAHDVRLGYTSDEAALRRYGVALTEAGTVDEGRTHEARRRLRDARVVLRMAVVPGPGTRVLADIRVHPTVARRVNSRIVELVTARHAAPLRVLLEEDASVPEDMVLVGSDLYSILPEGDRGAEVRLRPLDEQGNRAMDVTL